MVEAKGLVAVWLEVPPASEEEFNDWYDTEHLDEVVNIRGFVEARRYVTDRLSPKYLAWYEAVDETVEPGPGFSRLLTDPTPWSRRMARLYGANRIRNNYRLVTGVGAAPSPDAPWMYIVQADCGDPAQQAEFDDWYDMEHLPALAAVPGVLRARRWIAASGAPRSMAAYEMTGPEVFESPGWLAARDTPRTPRMRTLIANGRRAMYRLILPTIRPRAG